MVIAKSYDGLIQKGSLIEPTKIIKCNVQIKMFNNIYVILPDLEHIQKQLIVHKLYPNGRLTELLPPEKK